MQQKEYLKTEYIGKTVTIPYCSDPTWINKTGRIIDETQKTFILDINGIKKCIAKQTATFEITIEGEKITIEGSCILYQPENRIKKTR